MKKLIKLLVASVAALGTLLIIEGAYSLFAGESLIWDRVARNAFVPGGGMEGVQAQGALGDAAGRFALSSSPLVASTLRANASGEILGAEYRTDQRGMRVVPNNAPADTALRLAIVGDSVAFGFGVRDGEHVAARVSEHLRSVGLSVYVDSIACPGWNATNSLSFASMMQRLKAYDAIYWVPVPNDLHDAHVIGTTGRRRRWFDPSKGAGSIFVSLGEYVAMLGRSHELGSVGLRAAVLAGGGAEETIPHVVDSGLSPESIARWDRFASEAAALRELVVEARGSFVVVIRRQDAWHDIAELKLRDQLGDEAILPLFRAYSHEDRLPTNPHPNAGYHDQMGLVVAQDFVSRQGLKPSPAPSAAQPKLWSKVSGRRSNLRPISALRATVNERMKTWGGFLLDSVVPGKGQGLHQIYGGLRAQDFTFHDGVHFALKAKNPSSGLRIRLVAPDDCDQLSPLQVRMNGGHLQTIDFAARSGSKTFDFKLPTKVDAGEVVDFSLRMSIPGFAFSPGRIRFESAALVP